MMVEVGSESLWEPENRRIFKETLFSGHKIAVEHMNSWQGWLVTAGTRSSHIESTMDHEETHEFSSLHGEAIDNWWLGRKERKFCLGRWSLMAVHKTVGAHSYIHTFIDNTKWTLWVYTKGKEHIKLGEKVAGERVRIVGLKWG